jgi:signal transduction histidine kinase
LRTPLAIICGEVDVTLERPRTSPEYIEALGSIGGETERMMRLINELLMLARSDAAELQLDLESLDLAELLAILVEQMQHEAVAASVDLRVDLPTPLPVRGDRDRLLQLFINLLENGFIYAPGCRMVIRGRLDGDAVQIEVTDTGPGIAPEHLPFLFERFYRVDKARNRASGGSGLGLAISQEIVHAHQGTIRVESEVDVGTTFIIRLPRDV